MKTVQYAHDLLDKPLRTDLKPYIVQQPDGPSFTVDGRLVKWQKWRFRVGLNVREGLVIYNVTYDGRNLFYRLALSEMTVPYGGIFTCHEWFGQPTLTMRRSSQALPSETSL